MVGLDLPMRLLLFFLLFHGLELRFRKQSMVLSSPFLQTLQTKGFELYAMPDPTVRDFPIVPPVEFIGDFLLAMGGLLKARG